MNKVARLLKVPFFLLMIVPGILPASGHSLICRSDPIVILSNGMTLDLGADIDTLPMQVQEVHYELHVPHGVGMILAIHTPAWITSQETFKLIADQSAGNYETVTTVQTSVGDADVTADTTLVSALKIQLGHWSVKGQEGDPLSLTFHG